jgi:hypothetical protein
MLMRCTAAVVPLVLAVSASAMRAHSASGPRMGRLSRPRPLIMAAPYEALHGGRPGSAKQIDGAELANTIRRVAMGESEPQRVWLDVQDCTSYRDHCNGESLVVVLRKLRDDSKATCTMSVRQTRVLDACDVDSNPEGCRDVGCVAVRWNLSTSEAVLIDLFKGTKGERVGCDISSADNREVKWGRLMLGIVDDLAALLHVRHVYLGDEASTKLVVWSSKKGHAESVQVMLKYLHPLVRGVGYYEPHGYYNVKEAQYYGLRGECADRVSSDDMVAATASAAARDLNAFNQLRTAPFCGGEFARALLARGAAHAERGGTPVTSTLIYRFALALASVHDASVASPPSPSSASFAALRHAAAALEGDDEADGSVSGPLHHQHWTHSRTPLPGDPSLSDFLLRHARTLDSRELLDAPHLGAVAAVLHRRNRDASHTEDGQRAGALLLELMFDFFAVWSPTRQMPLKRKDLHEGGEWVSALIRRRGAGTGGRGIAAPGEELEFEFGRARRVPVIQKAYVI